MNLNKAGLSSLKLKGARVLMRVDFNVPRDKSGAITDDTRIRAALPTIQAVLAAGGQPILMSHLGRPDGEVYEDARLDVIGAHLADLIGKPVVKLNESMGSDVEAEISGTE